MKKLLANLNRHAENLSAPVAVILEGRVIDSDWHTVDYADNKRGIKNLLSVLCDQLAK